jgi:hypothetical protein
MIECVEEGWECLDSTPHISDVGIKMRAKYGGEAFCNEIVDDGRVSVDVAVDGETREIQGVSPRAKTFEEKLWIFAGKPGLPKDS